MSFTSKTALLFLFAISIYAQGGIIRGKVVDKESNEPLIGANILIEDKTLGAASDIDGIYVIRNIPKGNYIVKASYIGFTSFKITDIEVKVGSVTVLNFELECEDTCIVQTSKHLIKNKTACSFRVPTGTSEYLPTRGFLIQNQLKKFKLNPPNMQPVLLKDTTTNKNISR